MFMTCVLCYSLPVQYFWMTVKD